MSTLLAQHEKNLPMLFLSFPVSFLRRWPRLVETARRNSRQRLVTSFDVHKTAQHLLHLQTAEDPDSWNNPSDAPDAPPAYSLLTDVPSSRTCKDAAIPNSFCSCVRTLEVIDTASAEAVRAGKAFVDQLNAAVESVKHLCATYRLKTVLKYQLINGVDKVFLIRIQVSPNEGVFETMLIEKKKKLEFNVKDLQRVDSYGETSLCVESQELRPICFCKDLIKKET